MVRFDSRDVFRSLFDKVVNVIRRYTVHTARSIDDEILRVITIYEPFMTKKRIKKLNRFTKKYGQVVTN